MSTHTHASHGGHDADHVPHVLDLKYYLGVFAALLVFTVITVAVSYVDLGAANLFVAMLVATCKALMVGAIFMHLAFDKKFNAIIFGLSVLFLFIFIAFTMFDTNYRGLGGRISGDRPANISSPFEGTKGEAALKQKWQGGEAPAKAPAH